MIGNNDSQHGTDSKDGAGASVASSENSGDSTQNNEPQDTGSGSGNKGETLYTQDQVNELLSKIRSDEKKKHQGKLEETSTALKTQMDKMKELEEQLSGAQKRLEKLQEGKKSDKDKDGLSKELEDLRAEREKLQKGMEELASLSAQQIVDTELRMKKELLIQKHGIKFPELVSGDTVEELEASAKKAAEREKALVEKAAKEAEDRTKKALSSQAAAGLPKPISTNASLGNGNDLPSDLNAREKIVKLPRDEYLKRRAEILQEARRKAGL
jgi:hypothetical protein